MGITRRLIASAILLFHSAIYTQSAAISLHLISLFTMAAALLLLFNYTHRAALAAAFIMLIWEGTDLLDGATAESLQKLVINVFFIFLLLKDDSVEF